MKLHPYLIFNGQAQSALRFYCESIGLTHGEFNTYEKSPIPHESAQKDWIMHVDVMFEDQVLFMMSDGPDFPLEKNNNVHISLNYEDLDKMKLAFDRLSKGGKINRPLEKQFWNATYGQLTDQFGIHWMMNCDHH